MPLQSLHSSPLSPSCCAGPPEAWPCPPLSGHPLTIGPHKAWPHWPRPRMAKLCHSRAFLFCHLPLTRALMLHVPMETLASSEQPSRLQGPLHSRALLRCGPLLAVCVFPSLSGGEAAPEGPGHLSPQHKAWHACRNHWTVRPDMSPPRQETGSTAWSQRHRPQEDKPTPASQQCLEAKPTHGPHAFTKANDPVSHKGKPPDSWF